ncbi:hypothetical protein CRUP_016484 [Coryphaenoides rupestris]|nr:hypothetical protein CRUP_016484 [Coryphaenoides rupestris]
MGNQLGKTLLIKENTRAGVDNKEQTNQQVEVDRVSRVSSGPEAYLESGNAVDCSRRVVQLQPLLQKVAAVGEVGQRTENAWRDDEEEKEALVEESFEARGGMLYIKEAWPIGTNACLPGLRSFLRSFLLRAVKEEEENPPDHRTTQKIARMARDMSDKEILKMELDQLKLEVNTTRTPMAANCADTIAFVEGLAAEDPLIKGVSDEKNPYKGDKGGCTIT